MMPAHTAAAALALALLAPAGCGDGDAVCGPNTIDREGECVVDPSFNAGFCGPATHFDSLRVECVSNALPIHCYADTTRIVGGDGTVVCVCEPETCEVPLPCTPPSAGRVTVCGTVADAQSGALLTDAASITVAAFDVDELVAAPDTATPLATAEAVFDTCGRYRLHDILLPANGFVAIVVDDAPAGGANDYEVSARVVSTPADTIIEALDVRATLRVTDTQWTATAGDPFDGQSFVDRGVSLARFFVAGEPAAGVQFLCNGDPFFDAYYFSDPDPATHGTVDSTRLSSGANGSALIAGVPTINQCEPSAVTGCAWSEPVGAVTAIRGVVTYAEYFCE